MFLLRIWQNQSVQAKLFIQLLLIPIFVGIYYIVTYSLLNIDSDNREIPNLIIQIGITIIFSFAFISYTFNKNQEEEFFMALSNLISEMMTNTERLSDDFLNSQLNDIPIKIQNNDWPGFFKWPSFTNWDNGQNFYLKYLPNTYYYNFVTQGFFCSDFAYKMTDDMKQIIAKTYFKFNLINLEIQKYENNVVARQYLPQDYCNDYLKFINKFLGMYYTQNKQNFFLETLNVINLVIYKYPEINQNENFQKLKKNLIFN